MDREGLGLANDAERLLAKTAATKRRDARNAAREAISAGTLDTAGALDDGPQR